VYRTWQLLRKSPSASVGSQLHPVSSSFCFVFVVMIYRYGLMASSMSLSKGLFCLVQ